MGRTTAKEMLEAYTEYVKMSIKRDLKNKMVVKFIKELKYHFNNEAWALDYLLHRDEYPGTKYVFDTLIVEKLKLRIRYDKKSVNW